MEAVSNSIDIDGADQAPGPLHVRSDGRTPSRTLVLLDFALLGLEDSTGWRRPGRRQGLVEVLNARDDPLSAKDVFEWTARVQLLGTSL